LIQRYVVIILNLFFVYFQHIFRTHSELSSFKMIDLKDGDVVIILNFFFVYFQHIFRTHSELFTFKMIDLKDGNVYDSYDFST